MILAFLYHCVGKTDKYSNSKTLIKKHLKHLAKKYNIVLPGEKINPFKINVCLTFDDAFFDFYYYIYPLIKKLKIKAVVAIPIKYIVEKTSLDPKVRLSVSYKDAMSKDIYLKKVPFCTWTEIKEMLSSNLIEIASHSYNHVSLTKNSTDLDLEIIKSKKFLENKLNIKVNTFIYPHGKFNENIHKYVLQHYKYVMRIGSAVNFSWQNINSIIYRIMSDDLKSYKENLKLKKYISYFWFFLLNSFRKR